MWCLLGAFHEEVEGTVYRVGFRFQAEFNACEMMQRGFQQPFDPDEPHLLQHLAAVAPELFILDSCIDRDIDVTPSNDRIMDTTLYITNTDPTVLFIRAGRTSHVRHRYHPGEHFEGTPLDR